MKELLLSNADDVRLKFRIDIFEDKKGNFFFKETTNTNHFQSARSFLGCSQFQFESFPREFENPGSNQSEMRFH